MSFFALMLMLVLAAIVILVGLDLRRTRGRPAAIRALRAVVIAFVTYIAGGAVAESRLAVFPLTGSPFATLRTFDANGQARETVIGFLREPNGQVWITSGHWPSLRPGGWYYRVLANPDIELIRDGQAMPMHAISRNDPEALKTVTRLLGKGRSSGYWIYRTLLLWPPIKALQLDPRPARESRR